MTRVPEVIDCWFDSGAMPFAQFHYPFENKELFESRFLLTTLQRLLTRQEDGSIHSLLFQLFFSDRQTLRTV